MSHSFEDLVSAKNEMTARYLVGARKAFPTSGSSTLEVALAAADPRTNVHAIGVGQKLAEGNPTGELAVRFYVHQKMPLSVLAEGQALPTVLDGMPVDVVESPPAQFASEAYRSQLRPVQGGTSVAHYRVTAGTIGCICRSNDPADGLDALFALSNNHILANLNSAELGDVVFQPGPMDGGTNPIDRIGRLHRFVPITETGNRVDCAIAMLDPEKTAQKEIYSIGAITGVAEPEEYMTLRKHGRTTGFTAGTVSDLAVDVSIPAATGNVVFHNQFRVNVGAGHTHVAQRGDSGSLFVDTQNRAVGLLFACGNDGSYALACRFSEVQDQLRISLWV